MHIKFESDLDYQRKAVAAVVDLFRGQERFKTRFTLDVNPDPQLSLIGNNQEGTGNALKLVDEELLQNLRHIQMRNGVPLSPSLGDLNFTVEMETGTGKTYVYLRTMYELNREYGFTKFIVVVPSVAIREGVLKTLQMTEKHFRELYSVPADYCVYDSGDLPRVRDFASDDQIQIMVINIDAFRKGFTDPSSEHNANIIHRAQDRFNGRRPIDLIGQTSPIVFIDEPQTVDTTAKSAVAIASLNPLCTFRYSATHRDQHHPVYRLDAVDAYEMKLVKQIEVAGTTLEDAHELAYVRLLDVRKEKGAGVARLELDAFAGGKVKRTKKTVRAGDDLFEISGQREMYRGLLVDEVSYEVGEERLAFAGGDLALSPGQAIGEGALEEIQRIQVRKTIQEHLRKEVALRPRGIKVLSLFFIDRVANYRAYDKDGVACNGKLADVFEEEYARLSKAPEFNDLFDDSLASSEASEVHGGYFSVDRKNRAKDTSGKTAADEDTFSLIMKDKERLLSFDSKLRFIFSHTALREGWDNPNVFQICTLNDTKSVMKKRQEIGRGLRIAVNQDGERVRDADVNILTVFANESYEEFAKTLQAEMEELGIRFGVVERHLFAGIPVLDDDGRVAGVLGTSGSEEIWASLHSSGYVDEDGNAADALKLALHEGSLSLPDEFAEHRLDIEHRLQKVTGGLKIRNRPDRTAVEVNTAVFLSDDFKALWDRIKHRTTYRVDFDAEKLVKVCVKSLRSRLKVPKARYRYQKGEATIGRSGVEMKQAETSVEEYESVQTKPPDVLGYMQQETRLTRRTLAKILVETDRFDLLRRNPQKFIEQAVSLIKAEMRTFVVAGIKYERLGADASYSQDAFLSEKVWGYLQQNMVEVEKSVFKHVVFDSGVERDFATGLELSQDVSLFAKLPPWFKVDTPLGSYNPDWAVVMKPPNGSKEKLYFVVETKSKPGLFEGGLRRAEEAKIECGEAHFKAVGSGVEFREAHSFDDFQGSID